MGLFSSKNKAVKEEPVKDKKQEKKERVYQDVHEMVKFVCHGGKVMCPFCMPLPIGDIVSFNPVLLQDKPYATTRERNGKINLDFKGGACFVAQKTCKAVISLGSWKNYSDVHINNDFALLRRSTIPCLISGQDILIVHSGQMALLTDIDPLKPKRLKIAKEYFQLNEATVCHKLRYRAIFTVYGEEVLNDNIRWKVKISDKEEVPLESVAKIIKKKAKLTGNEIEFPIPKEWRYEKIILIAYLENEPLVNSARGMTIQVKDHIVAAFFRLNNEDPKAFPIEKVEEAKGTFNFISEAPVHHHQGMFKYGNQFYISGSTGDDPSYIYRILVDKEDKIVKFDNPLLLHKDLKKFKHPGGLQVANGILAVGIEQYFPIIGTHTIADSVVCFFDVKDSLKELENLRIVLSGTIKDENGKKVSLNNFASAVGIVFYKNAWIVAVRGKNKEVLFYWFEDKKGKRKDKKTTKGEDIILHIGTVPNVAEFQNLNLFLDENNEIYLFGMGKNKMGEVDTCKIYKIKTEMEDGVMTIDKSDMKAAWINDEGIIEYVNYDGFDQNKLIFTCNDGASFHWASCVSLQKNPDTGILDSGNEDPNFIGTPETGFLGKLTVYTVEGTVRYDKREIITDNGWTKEYKQQYLRNLEEFEKMGVDIDWEEEDKYLKEISNHTYYEYTNPRINCNSFNE